VVLFNTGLWGGVGSVGLIFVGIGGILSERGTELSQVLLGGISLFACIMAWSNAKTLEKEIELRKGKYWQLRRYADLAHPDWRERSRAMDAFEKGEFLASILKEFESTPLAPVISESKAKEAARLRTRRSEATDSNPNNSEATPVAKQYTIKNGEFVERSGPANEPGLFHNGSAPIQTSIDQKYCDSCRGWITPDFHDSCPVCRKYL
jgi:hypothetical protein